MAIVMMISLFPLSAFSSEEAQTDTDVEEPSPPLVNVIETKTAEGEAEAGTTPQDTAGDSAGDALPDPSVQESPDGLKEDAPESDNDDAPASGEPDPELDGNPGPFLVSYYLGEALLASETVANGEHPVSVPAKAEERVIAAWTNGEGSVISPASALITADTAFYAHLMPQLKREEHYSYINGYENGTFSPNRALTRGEAAAIISRLLDSSEPGPIQASFSDVTTEWYAAAVNLLASYGIVNGYTDGTFCPNNSITRAEFVAILVRVTGAAGTSAAFTDISANHWAKTQIAAAAANGWISGYPEEGGAYTFRPGRAISRAEAVTVINRVLGRSADLDALNEKGVENGFTDVGSADWYYGAVMEASITHSYERVSSIERWVNYNPGLPDSTPGIHLYNGRWYMIDASGNVVQMKAGINEYNGSYYYSGSAGRFFDGNLSSKSGYCVFADGTERSLVNGFNRINNTLFYWNTSSAAPKKLNAGLNFIDGTAYWADEPGYVIRNDFFAGVVSLGGKYYLSRGYCDIITSGLGYKNAESKLSTIDLKKQTYEYNDHMYYLKDDYSLACDEWAGYLYFGEDCAYTSGNSTVDSYVWNVVKDFINNTSLTKVQKLLRAYYYVRGGSGSTAGTSPFKYRNLSTGYKRGRYNEQTHYEWIINCAYVMYTTKAGMCYQWASAYLFLAKRLGFQCYLDVGSVFSSTARHCWCMIEWDSVWHISDVEIEWGYMARWYTSQPTYRNLFDQAVSTQYFSTYTNPECGVTYWVWTES